MQTAVESAADPVVATARPVAVSVAGLSKTFRGPPDSEWTLRERLKHPGAARAHQPLQALRDVDLEVRRGEFLAVVGRNGSGKSTLLRCIADIYPPDRGRVSVRGRMATFIELGVGFNPQLTGRENALTNAVLMGLPRRTARRRLEEMLAFAELEEFAEMHLKDYSSGMKARLAFAVAAHVDADLLLLDEVLAVGDAAFRQKCRERFAGFRRSGATVVLVTHNMADVEQLCDRALVLERGRVDLVDSPERAARRYQELNRPRGASGQEAGDDGRARGPAPVRADAGTAALDSLPAPREATERDPGRLLELVFTFAGDDVRLRYRGSILGAMWAIGRPLALFGILYFVFTQVVRFDHGLAHYPIYLLLAVVLWQHFSEVTRAMSASLVSKGSLLQKIRFPRLAIPLAASVAALATLGPALAVVLGFMVASGITPGTGWLQLLPLVLVLHAFATGVGLLLAALYVRFRDVAQLWTVALQALFYGSAVLYPVSLVPGRLQEVAAANPLAATFTQAYHALVDPSAPSAAAAIGGDARLAFPLAMVALTVLAAGWLFAREEPHIAERV